MNSYSGRPGPMRDKIGVTDVSAQELYHHSPPHPERVGNIRLNQSGIMTLLLSLWSVDIRLLFMLNTLADLINHFRWAAQKRAQANLFGTEWASTASGGDGIVYFTIHHFYARFSQLHRKVCEQSNGLLQGPRIRRTWANIQHGWATSVALWPYICLMGHFNTWERCVRWRCG